MSFRRIPTEREYWERFCDQHSDLILQLDRIALAFQSPDRFEDLLEIGMTASANESVDLQSLSDGEWKTFTSFVARYADQWQTWFVETAYPAYFREVHRRGDSHLTIDN